MENVIHIVRTDEAPRDMSYWETQSHIQRLAGERREESKKLKAIKDGNAQIIFGKMVYKRKTKIDGG